MAEEEQNRSEHASQHKLREARNRGQVQKSIELNSFAMLTMFLAVIYFGGKGYFERATRLDYAVISAAGKVDFSLDLLLPWLNSIGGAAIAIVMPLFVLLMLCAIVVNIAYSGPTLSLTPLKPDLDRLNPVSGLKRLFTIRLVLEAVKSILKLLLFGAVIYFAVRDFLPALMGMSQQDVHVYPAKFLSLFAKLFGELLLVYLLIAAIDFAYGRWNFQNKLRMSRRELNDEIKQREGEPRIRSRRRELQKELLKRSRSLSKVKDADVLITNPTHLAVGLQYKRETMHAPVLIASGAGELAAHMIELARRHQVPVVQNKKLAAAIYHGVNFDDAIPEKLYPEVARILVSILTKRNSTSRAAPA